MNQILSVDDGNKKEKRKKDKIRNSAPMEIQTILKIFSIAILIFGIGIIGTGSYSMYKQSSQEMTNRKPVIYVEQISEKEVLLRVSHEKALATITYNWNEEGQVNVPTNNQKEVETTIEIPTGINTLKIHATDINGQEIEYEKVYTVESDININIEPEGNDLKITVNGMQTLQYMTYRWDEDEETRIDIESDQVEETIEIPKGLHKLTVIVVDINNQTETKELEVNGVTKPKLEVTTDGSNNFIIRASDEQGIKKIEFIINEEERYRLNLEKELPIEQRKEFEYTYPLHDGENKLEVIVYNESDVTETFRALVNK